MASVFSGVSVELDKKWRTECFNARFCLFVSAMIRCNRFVEGIKPQSQCLKSESQCATISSFLYLYKIIKTMRRRTLKFGKYVPYILPILFF